MQRIARNAGRALRLDRDLYSSLLFDGSATADAILIVAVIGAVPALLAAALGRLSVVALPEAVLRQVIGYLVGWIVAAGILHLLSTRVFGGYGRWQAGLALAGYAYVPFVVVAAILPVLGGSTLTMLSVLVRLGGAVWFGAGLMRVADVAYDVARDRRIVVAGLAVVGWWLITLILL